jgi:SnoaL-like domain
MTITDIQLEGVIAEHIRAVNSFDLDAIMATFAPDAYLNSARREIRGAEAVRRWVEKEVVSDHVTPEPANSAQCASAPFSSAPASTNLFVDDLDAVAEVLGLSATRCADWTSGG